MASENAVPTWCSARRPSLPATNGLPTYRRVDLSRPFWPKLAVGRLVRRVYKDDRNNEWVAMRRGREEWEAVDERILINGIPEKADTKKVPVIRPDQFEGIPYWRQDQLKNASTLLVERHSQNRSSGRPTMDYWGVGEMLMEIAYLSHMTEIEKAYVWTYFCDGRGNEVAGGTRGYAGGRYNVSIDGSPNEVRDNDRPLTSPNHSWAGFSDSHHGGYMWSDKKPGIFNTSEQTSQEINDYEWLPFTGGDGDKTASERLVRAFRAFGCGGFISFAIAWNEGFVAR
jgi:hypothetical protein